MTQFGGPGKNTYAAHNWCKSCELKTPTKLERYCQRCGQRVRRNPRNYGKKGRINVKRI